VSDDIGNPNILEIHYAPPFLKQLIALISYSRKRVNSLNITWSVELDILLTLDFCG
jgi:hypothetical protein